MHKVGDRVGAILGSEAEVKKTLEKVKKIVIVDIDKVRKELQ